MNASSTDFIPFSQIIGQEKAISFLKRVIAQEKIPHAYLFAGIPGIGKTTTAIALTRAMNCQEPARGEGCGRCQPCRQINSGNFPDVEFIRPDGQNIKIEQIRNLDRTLAFKPLSGRYRVSIIRQAEAMTQEAANAFLKTLEEPPPGNILILNVTEPLDLLPTIVSRCQKVAFRPIPARLIKAWLKDRKGLVEDEASILAKISDGSLGRAIEMWESNFLAKRHESLVALTKSLRLSPEEVFEMV
ncbi:MAG: DNA polymerase III subunit delta', partial [Desulfobacteraceae bacterium]